MSELAFAQRRPPQDSLRFVHSRWKPLLHDQMTFEVLPSMAELFQTFDGAPYPDMTCRTCHGKDAEEVHYKMPHGLPPLDPAHMPEPGTHDRRARLTQFMIESDP